MNNLNPADFRPPESVTPLKRRAQDGIVYERTGEKRNPLTEELIWHDGTFSAPYPYNSERDGPIVTPIWKVSKDQNWQPPEVKSAPDNEIDRLIQEIGLGLTEEYGKYLALGSLYQVKQLERIANALDSLCASGSIPEGLRGSGSREVRGCRMCRAGEHSRCVGRPPQGGVPGITYADCRCEVCNQGPHLFPPLEGPYYGPPHRFEGMEDNHFCTKCGGGRLHAIHQG